MASNQIIVRSIESRDRAAWESLYAGYREFYQLTPDDGVVDTVWGWLTQSESDVRGLVVELDGEVSGLAHFRRFSRPSSGTRGLYLDDLFVSPHRRGAGLGFELLRRLSQMAHDEGCSVVRWITASDNVVAQRLYERAARRTPWVTYDLAPGSL